MIRLYQPTEQRQQETISELFERYLWPELQLRQRSRDTISEYRRFCGRFDTWRNSRGGVAAVPAGSFDSVARQRLAGAYTSPAMTARRAVGCGPPAGPGPISSGELLRWRQALAAAGLGHRNINKHLGAVRAVLRGAAQYDQRVTIPAVRPLPCRTAAPRYYFDYQQLADLYAVCEFASWPSLSAAAFWRAFLVLGFNYGLRTNELLGLRIDRPGLRWGQLHLQPQCPRIASRQRNAEGWFVYTPQKQRRLKPEPLVLPLNGAARTHLEQLAEGSLAGKPPAAPLFNCPRSDVSFYRQWRALIAAARLPADSLPSTLRKTSATWHEYQRPGIAAHITGHGPFRVCDRHYVNILPQLQQALQQLPQPWG